MLLMSVSLKSSADHVGECFCLCTSLAAVTSSSGGQASATSAVSLGQYSLSVQRQVVMYTFEYLHGVVNTVIYLLSLITQKNICL